MIAVSEGTKDVGDDGYNVLVGSRPNSPKLFDSYNDHPRQVILVRAAMPDKKITALWSTAAGRYQILARMYDSYKPLLNLQNFGHEAQDKIALQMINECHAMDDIDEGRIVTAIGKCKSRWASLPGAGYDQHENKLDFLLDAFTKARGTLA